MTEVVAIVRRQRVVATRTELLRAGCPGYTVFSALGRGRQRGLRPRHQADGNTAPGHAFLPRAVFRIVIEDGQALEMVEAVIRANQTGEFGDGRIFLSKLDDAYRMSDARARVMEVVS